MATQVQIRKGTTAQHASFTGAVAELSVDTDKKTVVVHDGTTAGGVPLVTNTRTETITGTKTFSNAVLTTSSFTNNPTLSGGTANGVLYLNGSKVATSGSALVFDGTNLGIGISPSAWTNGPAIQAAGFGLQSFSSTLMLLHQNSYYNSGTGYIYRTTAAASMYAQTGGQHQWYNAPSGTAGNAITYTQAMTLDASGNLGVGTSSPAVKLDVVGAINASFSVSVNSTGSNTVGGGARFVVSDTATSKQWIQQLNASYGLDYWTYQGSGFNKVMTIDGSGNLGLGVTPSAWGSGHRALDIGSNSYVSGSTSMTVENNVYYNGTNNLYKNSAAATQYQQTNSGTHTWSVAASGTAGNAISFTQAMTLDASGNLGVGTTSPNTRLEAVGTISARRVEADQAVRISSAGGENYIDSYNNANTTRLPVLFRQITTSGTTEAMRLDSSGNLTVNGTAAGVANNNAFWTSTSAYFGQNHESGTASGTNYAYFAYNAGTIGSITQSGTTAVAYNTSSDYRLKDNPQPLTGSGAFIDALKPKTWNWKTDGSAGVGFIAHEVQEVSPNSVVGQKDAVDEDGKPIMQAMEYGSAEFIANIIAELQSLRARVAALES